MLKCQQSYSHTEVGLVLSSRENCSTIVLTYAFPCSEDLSGECFVDGPDRIFPFAPTVNGEVTIEKCKKLCFEDNDYLYAGLQYGNECWCGNETPNSPAPQHDCSRECSGDNAQKCGGPYRMSVYINQGNFQRKTCTYTLYLKSQNEQD